VLGITSGGGGGDNSRKSSSSRTNRSPAGAKRSTAPAAPVTPRSGGKPKKVTLSVLAARPVWVCLVDARGNSLIGGRTLTAGTTEGPFHSSSFRVTLGNSGGQLKLNGKVRPTPDSAVPLGYAVSASGTRPLSDARRPTCAGGTGGTTGASGTATPPRGTSL
jgi:hypothetical protein